MPRPVPLPPPPRPVPPPNYRTLLLEGELKPYGAEHLPYYTAYTVVVERYTYSGYPEVTMTFFPRLVCNRVDGCPGAYTPPASGLEVRNHYTDGCYSPVYEAFDLAGYVDDIRSAALTDNFGTSCASRDQLTAELEHRDGTREQLVGYRTY